MAESTTFPTVWWNGKLTPFEQATIHITQMGPASVSSVFEGIRAYQNPTTKTLAVFQLDAHVKRFLQSIRLIRLECDHDLDTLRQAVVTLVRDNNPDSDIYIRP